MVSPLGRPLTVSLFSLLLLFFTGLLLTEMAMAAGGGGEEVLCFWWCWCGWEEDGELRKDGGGVGSAAVTVVGG